MLVIRVELWPGGDKARARTLAEASVTDMSGLSDVSDYHAMALEHGSDVTGLPDQAGGFMIAQHPRRSSVWLLVAKVALRAAMRFTPERRAAR
ncbi:hypothetical protein [Xanthobacter autotrophicus]|uniref:hypothetical protein n=1 Tax=Xanthobacter autotrophicus TaxID=280 RepID=UPI00372C99C0